MPTIKCSATTPAPSKFGICNSVAKAKNYIHVTQLSNGDISSTPKSIPSLLFKPYVDLI